MYVYSTLTSGCARSHHYLAGCLVPRCSVELEQPSSGRRSPALGASFHAALSSSSSPPLVGVLSTSVDPLVTGPSSSSSPHLLSVLVRSALLVKPGDTHTLLLRVKGPGLYNYVEYVTSRTHAHTIPLRLIGQQCMSLTELPSVW